MPWAVVGTVLLALSACSPEKTPEQSMDAAATHLQRSETAAALIEARNALQHNPDLPRARYLLGMGLFASGDSTGAEAALRKALASGHSADETVPALARVMLVLKQFQPLIDEFDGTTLQQADAIASLATSLSIAHRAVGDAGQADTALAAALQSDPQYVPARLLQIRQQAARGDIDGALAEIDALLARQGSDIGAWLVKGDLLRDGQGRNAEAAVAYRKVIEIQPSLATGYLETVDTLLRLGKTDEAAELLTQLGKRAPGSVRGLYLQALLALDNRDHDQARKIAQQLAVAGPAEARYQLLAGDTELQFGSLLQAENYLSRAVKLAPQSAYARRLLATAQVRQQRTAEALATLKPLLDAKALGAPTLMLAGDIYRASGDPQRAADYYAQAARLQPANTRAQTSMALAHLASGKASSALGELRAAAATEAGVGPDLALITAHLERGEMPQALAAIDALQKKLPGSPLADNLRGRALLGTRDLIGARKNFDAALALAPDYFPAIDGLAAVDMFERKPEAARKRFTDLLARQPKHAGALLALANLLTATGGDHAQTVALLTRAVAAQPTAVAPRLRLVDVHLRAKNLAGALAAAQDAAAALPQNADAREALGRVQLARGAVDQAIVEFRQLASLQPQSPRPHVLLAQAQSAAKDKRSATDSLRKALAIQPNLLEAQRALAGLAVEAGDFPAALSVARSVQTQRPKEAAGYLLEGEIEAAQKRWAPAAAVLERGLKQVASPELARRAHAAYGAAGDAAAQDRVAGAWLKSQPKDTVFRLYLGDLSTRQGQFAAAEKMYAQVVQIEPAHAVALNNLAWVGGQLKRPDAVSHAEKAVALAPDRPGHIDTLAMLLAQRGAYDKALQWQRKALAMQPENPLFRLNLARIQILAGRKDEARRELQTLSGLGDGFRGQPEVARLLKSL